MFFSCILSKCKVFFCFSKAHYWHEGFMFFSWTLSKRDAILLFLMYTTETWINFCFSYVHYRYMKYFCFPHLHYQNVKWFLFCSCTIFKRQVVFVFLMYAIETWRIFYFSHVHYRNMKYFMFFSHVHNRNVKYFLFFSCIPSKPDVVLLFSWTLSKCEVTFVFLMYFIQTVSSF